MKPRVKCIIILTWWFFVVSDWYNNSLFEAGESFLLELSIRGCWLRHWYSVRRGSRFHTLFGCLISACLQIPTAPIKVFFIGPRKLLLFAMTPPSAASVCASPPRVCSPRWNTIVVWSAKRTHFHSHFWRVAWEKETCKKIIWKKHF